MAICTLRLGHRGVRREKSIPENTLAAFDYALSRGCDGFELNVRLTADGQAVICHDAGIQFKKIPGKEIAKSSSGSLGLPGLREVLVRYQRSAFLDIELKVPGLETITTNLLRELPPARGCVVSSFLPEVLEATHRIDRTVPLGLICETRAQLSRWTELPVEYVIPHHKLVHQDLVAQDFIAQIQAAGKKIIVWTVNAPANVRRFLKWGVDGIISDYPERLSVTRAATEQQQKPISK